ncbi:MAG TPA: T9SS type A sorting domain-containing protein, partial [Bacteroidia bacterium]|nr:T9SS type A sorting domain-containing protein [Bacteroidia bacterium]
GLSASQNEDVKFLSTVDPLTGVVTHVSNLFWYQGWWKPSGGGNCIDFATGTYYYSGAPDLLIGVNLITGDTTSVHATGQGSFLFVQCFTQCPCSPAGIEETSASAFNVFPNPATDVLTIQVNATVSDLQYCTVTDVLGREVMRVPVNNSSLTVSVAKLASGVYYWTMWSDEKAEGSGRFVKE